MACWLQLGLSADSAPQQEASPQAIRRVGAWDCRGQAPGESSHRGGLELGDESLAQGVCTAYMGEKHVPRGDPWWEMGKGRARKKTHLLDSLSTLPPSPDHRLTHMAVWVTLPRL